MFSVHFNVPHIQQMRITYVYLITLNQTMILVTSYFKNCFCSNKLYTQPRTIVLLSLQYSQRPQGARESNRLTPHPTPLPPRQGRPASGQCRRNADTGAWARLLCTLFWQRTASTQRTVRNKCPLSNTSHSPLTFGSRVVTSSFFESDRIAFIFERCVGSTQADVDNVTSSVSPWQPVMFSLISPKPAEGP